MGKVLAENLSKRLKVLVYGPQEAQVYELLDMKVIFSVLARLHNGTNWK